MKKFFSLIFALIFLSLPSEAAKDPHAPKAVMPAGRLKGQAISAERKRPVTLLPATQGIKYGAQPGDLVFANFFSEDRYWIAKLPRGSVSDVILQMEEFFPGSPIELAPHLQVRFKLKPGKEIHLYPQAGTRLPRNSIVSDVVVTAGIASVEGNDYNVLKSFLGDYVKYVRVLNSEDAFQIGISDAKHEIEQIALNLSDERKSELLEEGIRLSDKDGLTKLFFIKKSDCGTFVFCDLLENVLGEELKDASKPFLTYPATVKKYLAKNNLLDPATNGQLPNWEQEWANHIPEPKKKVLIFTVSHGGGHNSSAEAIRKRLLESDPKLEVIVKDVGPFFMLNTGKILDKGYEFLYQKRPDIWDSLYQDHMATTENLTSAAQIPSFFSEKALFDYLREVDPNVVLTVYNGVVPALARLKSEGLIGPQNFKIGWLHENFTDDNNYVLKAKAVDMTWSPHPGITNSLIQKGVPENQVQTTTLPLNPKLLKKFTESDRQAFIKKALVTPDQTGQNSGIWINGKIQYPNDPHPILLDPAIKTIFITSGKAGLGDFKTIVEGLGESARKRNISIQIVVGCGTNKKNYEDLTHMKIPPGVTLAVSKILDNEKQVKYTLAADLNIGKSGSQGPSEFSLSGKPRVLIDVVGAQEGANGKFFEKEGLAVLVPGSQQDKVADVSFALLENEAKLETMAEADEELRESINYQAIDDWTFGNLTPEAVQSHVPVPETAKISNFANMKSNVTKVSQLVFGNKQEAPSEEDSSRVRITNWFQKRFNSLTADFSGKDISVNLPGAKDPVPMKLGGTIGKGLGDTVYRVRSSYFDQFETASSGVVAKMAHTPKWRSEPNAIGSFDSFLNDEYRQYVTLRASLPALRSDPDFPKDFGWEKDPGRFPVADILERGVLENGNTILFKAEIHGSTVSEIVAKYGQNLPPEMIEGLKKIYDFSQVLYRKVTTDGRPFMLDIYPSNFIWVEKPEDLKIMGLTHPSFVMVEAFSLKKPIFQKDYSFAQFVNHYKAYIALTSKPVQICKVNLENVAEAKATTH